MYIRHSPINVCAALDGVTLGHNPDELLKQADIQDWVSEHPVITKAIDATTPLTPLEINTLVDALRSLSSAAESGADTSFDSLQHYLTARQAEKQFPILVKDIATFYS
ncbi:MAG: hypothetical protein O3A01_08290 [bacterium]|nr:hypothetical protein [bacterium]